jgi:YD repeat-containing protein
MTFLLKLFVILNLVLCGQLLSDVIEYDGLGRIQVVHKDDGSIIQFVYDEMGNRLSRIVNSTFLSSPDLQLTFSDGLITLQWVSIPGATSYRIESANSHDGPWVENATISNTTWSTSSSPGVKLFKVIALNPAIQ